MHNEKIHTITKKNNNEETLQLILMILKNINPVFLNINLTN